MSENLGDIRLTDLIDAGTLQRIQDAFSNATGMAALTVDMDGAVTRLSNPTDFCMKLTRGCAKGADRCNQCDLKGGEEARRTGKPSVYYCHGGLMDFAAPIMLDNKQIGSMIGGQVLPSPPDEKKFRMIARDIGVSEEDYVRAVRKVRIVPQKTIEASANLLFTIASELSNMGYQKFRMKKFAEGLFDVSGTIHIKIDNALDQVQKVSMQNEKLIEEFERLTDTIHKSSEQMDQTNQIAKYIGNVSMQTSLLGFNASIEASRAKEFGKGFGVIAQEIRRLADSSSDQLRGIQSVLSGVKQTTSDLSKQIEEAYHTLGENTQILKDLSGIITEMNNAAKQIEVLGGMLGDIQKK